MAFTATAVGRVRAGGNNANGAFYDAGIASAGTDYSQQDAAQLSMIDATSTNSTTITSVSGGFTTAMIGNAIRLTGTGVTSGYYFITARTDTNTITVDRVSGTYTLGVGNVGGAAAGAERLLSVNNAAGDKVVPGNIVYIRGSGSDTPSSPDYTHSDYIYMVPGNGTDGYVKVIGENGRPMISGGTKDLLFYNDIGYSWFENIYYKSGSSVAYGRAGDGLYTVIKNCVFDTNDLATDGLRLQGGAFIGSEIFSKSSAPTAHAGAIGIKLIDSGVFCTLVKGNRIHHFADIGISVANSIGESVCDNVIDHNKGIGINVASSNGIYAAHIDGNTIDANEGDGVYVADALGLVDLNLMNNNITNHTGGGKYGLNFSVGTTAANDRRKRFVDYNNFYNNTADRNAVSAGTHDTALDPQYTDAANGDYTIGTNLKAKGYPDQFLHTTGLISYVDIGGVQRQEAGVAGGVTKITFRSAQRVQV